VWIRRSSSRVGHAVFQCSHEATCATRLLEIPQWMFDAAVICVMRLAAAPRVSGEALREVKELIFSTAATGAEPVIQAAHQRLSHMGGSDAKLTEVCTSAARCGQGLLAGLLRCRRCGQKWTVLRYSCWRGFLDNGEPRCIAFGGVPADEAIGREVLRVVQPAAIEAAILASQEQTQKRDEVVAALQRDLEAARYAARRAQKQFDAADPENRLVADELERRWDQALKHVKALEEQLEQHVQREEQITGPSREEFIDLATQLEALWPDADTRLKKRIVRALIQEVVVDVDIAAAEVVLLLHWKGGVHSELRFARRRRGQNNAHSSPQVLDAVRLRANICSDDLIASALNRNHMPTGRGNRWTRERVTSLRSHHKIPRFTAEQSAAEGWMNQTQAAAFLGISPGALRLAVLRGEIEAQPPLPDGPWVLNRRSLQTPAAAGLVRRIKYARHEAAALATEQSTFEFSNT
jgi:hypothetical protein